MRLCPQATTVCGYCMWLAGGKRHLDRRHRLMAWCSVVVII